MKTSHARVSHHPQGGLPGSLDPREASKDSDVRRHSGGSRSVFRSIHENGIMAWTAQGSLEAPEIFHSTFSPAVRTSSVWATSHLLGLSNRISRLGSGVAPPCEKPCRRKERVGGKAATEQRRRRRRRGTTRPKIPNLLALRKKARTAFLPPPQRQNDDSSLHCPSECSPFTIGGVRVGQQPLSPVTVPLACRLILVVRPPSKKSVRLSAIEKL